MNIPDTAFQALRLLVTRDVDTRFKGCSAGLRWLRERGYLSDHSWGGLPCLSPSGGQLARQLQIEGA